METRVKTLWLVLALAFVYCVHGSRLILISSRRAGEFYERRLLFIDPNSGVVETGPVYRKTGNTGTAHPNPQICMDSQSSVVTFTNDGFPGSYNTTTIEWIDARNGRLVDSLTIPAAGAGPAYAMYRHQESGNFVLQRYNETSRNGFLVYLDVQARTAKRFGGDFQAPRPDRESAFTDRQSGQIVIVDKVNGGVLVIDYFENRSTVTWPARLSSFDGMIIASFFSDEVTHKHFAAIWDREQNLGLYQLDISARRVTFLMPLVPKDMWMHGAGNYAYYAHESTLALLPPVGSFDGEYLLIANLLTKETRTVSLPPFDNSLEGPMVWSR